MNPPKRAPQVDSLRGLAALTVAILHALVFADFFLQPGWGRAVASQLDVAVTVFFAISGFVLYRPFVRAHVAGTAPAVGSYAIRRVMRIGPAYWVALAIAAIALGWGFVFTPTGAVNYFGFLYLYGDHPLSAIQPGWTLCVELSFYVFLPIWAWLLRGLPARGEARVLRLHLIALSALTLASAAYTLVVLQYGGFANINPAATTLVAVLPAHLANFAIGMFLAVFWIRWQDGTSLPPSVGWIRARPVVPMAVAAILFGAAVFLVTKDYSNDYYYGHVDWMFRQFLFWAIAGLLLFPAVLPQQRSFVDRALNARPFVGLGIISYGMYLWHWPLYEALSRHSGPNSLHGNARDVAWVVVGVSGTMILGALSWVIVERPAINWAHRVTRHDKRDGGATTRQPVPHPEKG